MTPQERKVMELSLEALEMYCEHGAILKPIETRDAIKEALAQEKALQALHDENERLGLYKDAYAQPAVSETHKQEPTNDWSEWRGMVVQNLMRHGIDKDFARRLAHFYQDKAPQPKEPEQEPLEYWNAVEGWVKIDEVREHFNSVGCGTIYKTAGEGRVPLSLCKAQPEQEPVAWRHDMGEENGGWEYFEEASCPDCQPLYTTPPQPQAQKQAALDAKADNAREIGLDYEPVTSASSWFALVMNAAAELENASYCLRDEDAKRVAISGAKYYRDEAKALFTHPQPKAEQEQEPVAWRISYPNDPELGFWFAEGIGGEGCLNEPLYTSPQPQPQSEARGLSQSKPLSGYINGAGINANDLPHIVVEKLERAIEAAHGITKE